MLLVGEPVAMQTYLHWQQKGKKVFCGYGPAEITLGCTLVNPDADAFYTGYLGRSFSACLWVTDPEDANVLLPIGEVGELLVEGPTVAQGYVHNMDATRMSFIQPPQWLKAITGRIPRSIYRTGDLVRYTPSGGIEFFGRKDLQVKVHGQRYARLNDFLTTRLTKFSG